MLYISLLKCYTILYTSAVVFAKPEYLEYNITENDRSLNVCAVIVPQPGQLCPFDFHAEISISTDSGTAGEGNTLNTLLSYYSYWLLVFQVLLTIIQVIMMLSLICHLFHCVDS